MSAHVAQGSKNVRGNASKDTGLPRPHASCLLPPTHRIDVVAEGIVDPGLGRAEGLAEVLVDLRPFRERRRAVGADSRLQGMPRARLRVSRRSHG